MATWSTFREAESSLLARRRAQRGSHTLGDEADQALIGALALLPPEARDTAREAGVRLGAHVYSRRYHKDTLAEGIAVLSGALSSSGLGAISIEGAFHRSARVRYSEPVSLLIAAPRVRAAFLEGLIEGYLSHAFNCEAQVLAVDDHTLDLTLGAGRDVNQRGRDRG